MAYTLGYNVSPSSERILEKLHLYRGMTAKQLCHMLYGTSGMGFYTLAEEKSVYNHLRKLKKQGLVTAYKLQASVANGSIYYLTAKGYDFTKDLLHIMEGRTADGWIDSYGEEEGYPLADIAYETYTPPLQQTAHHLMLIQFFIEMRLIMADESFPGHVRHRNNLYAAKKYEKDGLPNRYRPDAEISLDGDIFAIEIDRATESHERLCEKFRVYRNYLDHLYATGQEKKAMKGIVFVVEQKRRRYGLKRRWVNLLAAFFKEMYEYRDHVNLIMAPLGEIRDTFYFECKRGKFEAQAQREAIQLVESMSYDKTQAWKLTKTNSALYIQGWNELVFKVFFTAISQEFESSLYARYIAFHKTWLAKARDSKDNPKIEYLMYEGYEQIIFFSGLRRPNIQGESLSAYELDPGIMELLSDFPMNVHMQNLSPPPSFLDL